MVALNIRLLMTPVEGVHRLNCSVELAHDLLDEEDVENAQETVQLGQKRPLCFGRRSKEFGPVRFGEGTRRESLANLGEAVAASFEVGPARFQPCFELLQPLESVVHDEGSLSARRADGLTRSAIRASRTRRSTDRASSMPWRATP